jgi:hypothetical protein
MAAVVPVAPAFQPVLLAGGDACSTDCFSRSQVALGNALVFAKLCLASGGAGLRTHWLNGGQCPPYISYLYNICTNNPLHLGCNHVPRIVVIRREVLKI